MDTWMLSMDGGWMVGWLDGWMDNKQGCWIDRWMADEQGWTHSGWMNRGWMDNREKEMDEQINVCMYRGQMMDGWMDTWKMYRWLDRQRDRESLKKAKYSWNTFVS